MVQHAESLNLDGAVHFTGVQLQSEVARLVAAADIAVSPFRDGLLLGSPMKIFEYMASGTPVIASSVGQIPSIIQDNVNGLLVPPEDVPTLASRIILLIKAPMLRSAWPAALLRTHKTSTRWNSTPPAWSVFTPPSSARGGS